MSEFKVGDMVRVKDTASNFGWLRRGQVGTITGEDFGVYTFKVPAGFTNDDDNPYTANESRYYSHELELIVAKPEAKEISVKDINSLLKKARKVEKARKKGKTLDYLREHLDFYTAVKEIVNK